MLLVHNSDMYYIGKIIVLMSELTTNRNLLTKQTVMQFKNKLISIQITISNTAERSKSEVQKYICS